MNPAQFLKEFEKHIDRDRMVDVAYDEMIKFCRVEGITIDDISNEELEELAEAFVDRGFNVRSDEQSHGLQYTLGFERVCNPDGANIYRFKTRRSDGEWETIDVHPGTEVKYLQNRL